MNKLFPIVLALLFFGCGEKSIHGCLDSKASNYNPEATIDNNSCEYVGDRGDWSSKEKSEFIHKCVGGDPNNEKKNSQCECIFEIVSSELSYEESKELDSSYSETKYQETEQDSRLKKLQSKIKKCLSKKYPKKNNKSK